MPFTMSNDFNQLDNGTGQNLPLYQNIDTLQERENKNPMDMLEDYQKNRNVELKTYQEMEKNLQQTARQIQKNPMDNLVLSRDRQLLDTKLNSVAADPSILYRQGEEYTNKMVEQMTAGSVGNNTQGLVGEKTESDKLINTVINYQIDKAPKYIEKTHFVSVSSLDRDWVNNSSSNRYQYKVSFAPSEDHTGAGVNTIFRNVISVEIINAIMPLDSKPVPYDNRIYLNTLHHPYLLLNVDELDGVFRGTNSASDKTFAHLIFDKEY